MAAPMDVVFSFDTTGSMSQVLEEVKCRLNDLIQRLQADIPQFKVGIIAHGDYCDKNHFYDIRTLDLTDNLPDVVNFLSETSGTGGGDIPECYELSLRHARDMSWREESRRVFVVIGDAYPHEPDYPENTLKIDWQEELSSLVKKNVAVYGVQYGHDPEAVSFFQRITGQSGGQHLRLQEMGDICHVIMAICYREQGPDQLQNYEAEIRRDNGDTNLKAGLQNVFDKLGISEATPAAAHQVNKPSLALLSLFSSFSSDGSADTTILRKDSVENKEGTRNIDSYSSTQLPCPPTPINMDNSWLSDSEDEADAEEPVQLHKQGGSINEALGTKQQMKRKLADKEDTVVKACSPSKKARLIADSPNSLATANRDYYAKTKQTKRSAGSASKGEKIQANIRSKRDAAGDNQFRFNDLPWSKWHLAAAQEVPESSGKWKSVAQRGCNNTLWRTDLLRYCKAKMNKDLLATSVKELRSRTVTATETTWDGALFEVGVISRDSRNIRAVWLHATNQRKKRSAVPEMLSQPWYFGLTRPIKEPLTAAVKAGCKVYLRWALVKDVQKTKREILGQYDYLWRS